MSAPVLILDTNVVLDWLVFGNPAGAPIEAALAAQRARWLVTAAMREELDRVLDYPTIAAWQPDRERIAAAWARWAAPVETAPAAAPVRCSDADDQRFVDLAVAERAGWLLTRDRALLKLARTLRSYGIRVAAPEAFDSGIR